MLDPREHTRCILGRQPIHELVDKSKELRVLDSKAAQNFGKARRVLLDARLMLYVDPFQQSCSVN